jgi:CRISPR-associated protein Csb1
MTTLTADMINSWADDPNGPVALHLKQKLLPVEGEGAVIFPPTYADIGYNIDTLSDGTKVCTIDSVGSQANRMEPIFKRAHFANLVPQINIEITIKPKDSDPYKVTRSLLEVAHRSADATVYATPTLGPEVKKAFHALRTTNDAGPLCRLAPTSLLFGVWDSRGGSGERRPRIVRSIIRGWDVETLHSAAQFGSIRKTLDEEQWGELEKEAKAKKRKLSDVGLDDAPSTFRRLKGAASANIPEYKNGSVNPDRRVLGGVLARGGIERDLTINLVALRRLDGENDIETRDIRRYVLSLALIVATSDFELYLREGCHLRFAGDDKWRVVPLRGDPVSIDLGSPEAAQVVQEYAEAAARPFRKDWPSALTHKFDLAAAKKLVAVAELEEEDSA